MRTINFGKNLRLSQIQPIKTAEFQIYPIWKKKGKTLHPVLFYSNVALLMLHFPCTADFCLREKIMEHTHIKMLF
jgi:hypothetical protein